MRVKVGNTWHEVSTDNPIMVEFTESDKKNIAGMPVTATKYAAFDDHDSSTTDQKYDWMHDKWEYPS